MTVPNTLADIRLKVRRLTARPSVDQITDTEIDEYINTYYLYDMPESLKFITLRDVFTFETTPNIDTYAFNNNDFISCVPPCYSAGQQMDFFQDRDLFYRTWSKTQFIQQVATGNGTNGPYTGFIPNVPFLRSVNTTTGIDQDVNFMMSANLGPGQGAVTAIDDGVGNFLAPAAGTVNYITGAFSVSFTFAVPQGNAIMATTVPYAAAQPRSFLFAQNQIILRPVPDQAYIVDVTVNRVPTQLINNIDQPMLNEWWQLLAFGAARKVLVDNADFETLTNIQPYYEEQMILMQRRSLTEYVNQRASTIYSDKGQYPYSNLYPYL